MALEFNVLGPIEVRSDGEPVALGGPQQRRIVAILIADRGRVVPVERLVEASWSDVPPEGARRTVMSYVSRVRLAIGDAAVVTQDGGYRLVDGGAVDADRFEQVVERARAAPPTEAITLLDSAVSRWRGRAFGEFAEEWWALPHATRLDELLVVAHEARVEALLAIGSFDRAVAELEGLVALHPLRERFVAQLMRAYDASGRQAEALRAFARHREQLADETGLDPSGGLRALESTIVGGGGAPGTGGPTRSRGYELGEVIAQGRFGVVYRSTQPGIGREVAVEVIRPELADDLAFVRRFESEAQRIAHLEHPHIVPLYDFWREPGGAYLVFRLLRGGSAADLLGESAPVPVERVSRIVTDVGGALAAAHAAGIVHGDVQAGSVRFDEAGHPYLADVGIAAAFGAAGTPADDQRAFADLVVRLIGRKVSGAPGAVLDRATASAEAERFDDMAGFVAAWVEAAHPAAGGPSPPAGDDDVPNPYVGLRAFGEADSARYMGREQLVIRLVERVEADAFVAVVGASGSGKSSVVNAGLVPRLRAAGWRVVSTMPGDDPVGQLRNALRTVAVEEPTGQDVASVVRSVAAQPGGGLVLVVDQLEELWTVAADADRELYVRGLADLVSEGGLDLRVVVAIRADFFDRPLAHPALGPLVADHPFGVTPMTAAELHEAIAAPAAAVGVGFEPGLDSVLVAEVANEPAGLPLLQFALSELFARRRGHTIERRSYDGIGGLAGAIASRAESVYSELDGPSREAARRLLLRLVVPGDGTDDTKRRVRFGELPEGAGAVVAILQQRRLLAADRDPSTREPTVELAHESLLRSWPRFRAWLDDDREAIRQLQQIAAAADAWNRAGRPESELYRGARLDTAVAVATARAEQLSPDEREFVEAGRAAAAATTERDRRARRRLRRGFVAASVGFVLALVAGTLALVQRHDADTQAHAVDVARLVSLSQSLAGSKRDVALLLAVEAAHRSPGVPTTSALQAALYGDPGFLGYVRTGGHAADRLAFAADGTTLFATPSGFGEAPSRIDLASRAVTPIPMTNLDEPAGQSELLPLDAGSALFHRSTADRFAPVSIERISLTDGERLDSVVVDSAGTLTLSPDGTRVAVTTLEAQNLTSRVVVLDVATLERVASIDAPGPGLVPDVVVSPSSAWIDDRHVLVSSASGRLVVWDVDTNTVVRTINDPPAAGTEVPRDLEVTPDGGRVVVSSAGGLMAYGLASGSPAWPQLQPAGAQLAIDAANDVVWAQEAGAGSSRLFAFDLATGAREAAQVDGQHGTVCDAKVSPDGRTLAVSSCNEGLVALWALDGRTATAAAVAPAGSASSGGLWSPDGRYVVVFRSGEPSAVELVDTRDGHRVVVPSVSASSTNVPVWRADGTLLAVTEDTNHLVVFDPASNATTDTGIILPVGHVRSDVVLRGDTALYGMDDGTVHVVDLAQRKVLRSVATDIGTLSGVGWSPDGRRVFAAGGSESGEVLDPTTGAVVGHLPGRVANLAVSPDGTTMVTADLTGTLRFLDTTTLEPEGDPLSGGAAFPARLQFTPDGRTVITSGFDNTMRFFDVASRQEIASPIAITSWGAAVSPDATQVAVTTRQGVVRLAFDAPTLVAAACRAAGRDLTAAEWAQYIGGPQRPLCPG